MKKFFLMAVATLGVSLMASAPAFAFGPSTSGNLLPKDNDLTDPFPALATGTYHVTFDYVGSGVGTQTWKITVKGNNDGNTAPGTPQAGTDIKHPARVIQVLTRDMNGQILGVAGGLDGATTNVDPDGAGPLLPGQSPHFAGFNTVAAQWDFEPKGTPGNDSSTWTSLEAPNDVAESDDYAFQINPYGANEFSALFTINTEGTAGAHWFTVDATDGNQQWSATLNVVPEPGALAMVLPGLLPLAFVLRRRRSSKSEELEA